MEGVAALTGQTKHEEPDRERGPDAAPATVARRSQIWTEQRVRAATGNARGFIRSKKWVRLAFGIG
ncbi:hypothetical protein GCM10027081_16220 [Cupriavidus yeoncheonensis]